MGKRKQSASQSGDKPLKTGKLASLAADAQLYTARARAHRVGLEEKLCILMVLANLRLNYGSIPGEPTKVAATLFGRSTHVIQDVWTEFKKRGMVECPCSEPSVSPSPPSPQSQPSPPPSSVKRSFRLVPSPSLASDVRRFVRERSEKRERTVAEDVLDLVVRLGYMDVVDGDEADRMAAIRCVQRYLAKEGYKRGKRKGASYRLSSANAAQRDEYILRMAVDPATTKRRKVYLDQSYVHHNYSSHNDSLYDPTDPLTTKEKHKGRRYCFTAAVIGDDPSVPPEEQVGDRGAHIITETIHIFEGGKATKDPTMGLRDRLAALEDPLDRQARLDNAVKTGKTTKDYHGMFVHEYIFVWMEILLDALDAKGFRACIIVLDNAKYHKVLPDHVPRKKDSRQKLVEACERYDLPVNARDTKPILWDKLQLYIRLNVVPVIVEMARKRGHDVIYTPPRFSDLQRIEYVWAKVKGIVGRQYTSETTFAQVRQRLEDAFEQVTPDFVRNCIKRTNQDLFELLALVDEVKDDTDEDSELYSDGCSSDSGDELEILFN